MFSKFPVTICGSQNLKSTHAIKCSQVSGIRGQLLQSILIICELGIRSEPPSRVEAGPKVLHLVLCVGLLLKSLISLDKSPILLDKSPEIPIFEAWMPIFLSTFPYLSCSKPSFFGSPGQARASGGRRCWRRWRSQRPCGRGQRGGLFGGSPGFPSHMSSVQNPCCLWLECTHII